MTPVQIYYVLFLREPIEDAEARFTRACNGSIELLPARDQGRDKAGVVLECHSTSERPVPDEQMLTYFGRGFNAESAAALGTAKAALALTGVGPFDAEHRLLRELTLCVGRLSRELDAVVLDAADWLTFTPKAFHDIRAAEVASGQFSTAQFGVRAYRVEGGLRSVSMGLEKFGQPNFAIPLFSEHQMSKIDRMMTLAMQHIIESAQRLTPGPLTLSIADVRNPRVKQELATSQQPGASGRAILDLHVAAPNKGDPADLLAPAFKASQGPQLWAEQGELLKRLFGADREVSNVNRASEVIQQAIEKARKEATAILSQPKEWQQEGRRLRVAVGLPKVNEVVWLEVTSWQNGKGAGILLSQPQHVRNLNSGDTVPFTADALMDYTLSNPEGVLATGGVDDLVRRLRTGPA